MARPQRQGLIYFPLDVDIDQDDKVILIEAEHGHLGFYVIIKMLMKIYKEGYFYEWTEKERLLFSKRVNADINSVNAIIQSCVKWGLFDRELFEKYSVLSSAGIQKRFFEANTRKKELFLIKDYMLIEIPASALAKDNITFSGINDDNNEVNVSINPENEDNKKQTILNYTKLNKTILNNNMSDAIVVVDEADINQIKSIFQGHELTEKSCNVIYAAAKGNMDLIKEKYKMSKKPGIKNQVGWVIKSLNDNYQNQGSQASSKDFEEREYDFNALEKQLLGR